MTFQHVALCAMACNTMVKTAAGNASKQEKPFKLEILVGMRGHFRTKQMIQRDLCAIKENVYQHAREAMQNSWQENQGMLSRESKVQAGSLILTVTT